MYLNFFGLKEPPFAITPDPRYLYLGERHENALAHLTYGIAQGGGGGFVQLTGEVGTGKTTLCRWLLENLPENTRAALILNPLLSPLEMLVALCTELKIPTRGAVTSPRKLIDKLNGFLLERHAAGERVVAVFDEAQNLSAETLEQIRLLTNLETSTTKLLQIVLLGQPELRQLLERPDLRQLKQRITARYHLAPLDADAAAAYISHRLAVAGADRPIFRPRALSTLHRLSGGIPRLLNIVADRALLAAYADSRHQVESGDVKRAWSDVHGDEPEHDSGARLTRALPIVAAMLLVIVVAGSWWLYSRHDGPDPDAMARSNPELIAPVLAAEDNPPEVSSEVSIDNEIDNEPGPESEPLPEPAPELKLPAVGFAAGLTELAGIRDTPLGSLSQSVADGCPSLADRSWHCSQGRGGDLAFAQTNRSMLLGVTGGYAIIARDESNRWLWTAAGQTQAVSLDDILDRWSGYYLDLWRVPGYVPELLTEGDRGPGVLWIKQIAGRASPNYDGPADDPYFGPSLRRWAEAFQAANGLPQDGLIGHETQRLLSGLWSDSGAVGQ